MRVLYIYNINRVAEIYSDILAQNGYAVHIFEPSLAGASASLPEKLFRMPERILDLRRVRRVLNNEHFDLVHIHWASYGILGLISQTPFVVECHGSDVRYRAKEPVFRSVLNPIFHRAKAVLCITPDLLAPVRTIRSDALFSPGPVDTNKFVSGENRRSQPWTILLFTRLDPIKGPGIAIEGIASFVAHHPDVRVQLLDWGILKDEYKIRYGHRFEFLPVVSPEEVPQLLASADVVVGQCRLGILSFCELQAMSCEKPVICPFYYDHMYATTPPVFRANSAAQIEDQLERVFQNPQLAREHGKQARDWVIEHHGLGKVVPRMAKLYQEICQW